MPDTSTDNVRSIFSKKLEKKPATPAKPEAPKEMIDQIPTPPKSIWVQQRDKKSLLTPPGAVNFEAMNRLSVVFDGFDASQWTVAISDADKAEVESRMPLEALPMFGCIKHIESLLTGTDFVFKFDDVAKYARTHQAFEGYRRSWVMSRDKESLGLLMACTAAILINMRVMFNDYLIDPNIDFNIDSFIQGVTAYAEPWAVHAPDPG